MAAPLLDRGHGTRHNVRREEVPRFGIPQERGDVDQNRVEERHVFIGVALEGRAVLRVGGDLHLLHPLSGTASQARRLVAREVEAATLLDEVEQRVEVGDIVVIVRRGSGLTRVGGIQGLRRGILLRALVAHPSTSSSSAAFIRRTASRTTEAWYSASLVCAQ